MSVDIKVIEEHMKKWQNILRLRDWDIIIRLMDANWRKSGDVKIDLDDKKAILLINSEPYTQNLEELIIHELLHIKLFRMDQMIEEFIKSIFGDDLTDPKCDFAYTQFFTLLEGTVEDLTKGFLTVGGEDKDLSFGRLQPQVNEELQKNKKKQ